MHDLGDALVHAGFADPVMEMETLTLEYDERRGGGARPQGRRRRTTRSPPAPAACSGAGDGDAWSRATSASAAAAALPATYEVIYGHAWKVAPRTTADGRQVIDFRPRAAA